MREEDNDWFKQMDARARQTRLHDLKVALVVLAISAGGLLAVALVVSGIW